MLIAFINKQTIDKLKYSDAWILLIKGEKGTC